MIFILLFSIDEALRKRLDFRLVELKVDCQERNVLGKVSFLVKEFGVESNGGYYRDYKRGKLFITSLGKFGLRKLGREDF